MDENGPLINARKSLAPNRRIGTITEEELNNSLHWRQFYGDDATDEERNMVDQIWIYVARVVCAGCAKEQRLQEEVAATKFALCSVCKLKHYCSPECQKKDWPRHKTVCRKRLKKGDLVRVHHLEDPVMGPKLNGSILQLCKDLTEEEEKAEEDPRLHLILVGNTPRTPNTKVMKIRKSKVIRVMFAEERIK